MQLILDQIVSKIEVLNPIHGKRLRSRLPVSDQEYMSRANDFLEKYVNYLNSIGKTIDYGIDCYLRMCADVLSETLSFIESGQYSCKSFKDANEKVYSKPEVMQYYMHALILSEFLWVHHYQVLKFFVTTLQQHTAITDRYLEIGAGHGLFVSEATRQLQSSTQIDVVDISPSSLEMTKTFVENDSINYKLLNIFDYNPIVKYDFITMGEVLEHVEDPVGLLTRVRELLNPGGRAFITTPTNAPAIDHIYLFKNTKDIVEVVDKAGLEVENDIKCITEDVNEQEAERRKITIMYAAILRIKNTR